MHQCKLIHVAFKNALGTNLLYSIVTYSNTSLLQMLVVKMGIVLHYLIACTEIHHALKEVHDMSDTINMSQ